MSALGAPVVASSSRYWPITAGRLLAALPGNTLTILMPSAAPGCQAGMSSSVASGAPGTAMPWWWRSGTSQPASNIAASASISAGKSRLA